ncbi:hypothetical protein EYF80_043579 [Liparis tanakae]|uniref:Uncharacterized protein n=1 Tax=Liparis tanakae TaxID=230148 RepID=A0A4Z2FYB3_9TELE|nr:hypothetical protein EYF80_043579 [Liparis tanakae]
MALVQTVVLHLDLGEPEEMKDHHPSWSGGLSPHCRPVDQVLWSAVVLRVGVAAVVRGVIGEDLLLGSAPFLHLQVKAIFVVSLRGRSLITCVLTWNQTISRRFPSVWKSQLSVTVSPTTTGGSRSMETVR